MNIRIPAVLGTVLAITAWAVVADIVPTDVQQPGTQPREVGSLESPDKCDNCHGGYDANVEPAHNWRGSMMANAGRDPLFWATLAVAEQDFDGAGDLCIRCHSPAGWSDGRSTPTDGSGLMEKDADGVQCDLCHNMVNPDASELPGVQNPPFVANDEGDPAQGYYGSGMYVLSPDNSKLGPYADAAARHQFQQSAFHRDRDFCGTCHDVSNPVVGDLADNKGTQPTGDPVTASGIPGAPVDGKVAFNNFPFQYGIVERTFSEHIASSIDDLLVSDFESLPAELQGGALLAAYQSAMVVPTGPDYADGTPRYYTCQTCHLRPVQGMGCNKKGAPIRDDLPLHDMTGGNYWVPDAIKWLDQMGLLRLGGGLTAGQVAALDAGRTRALKQLNQAATLTVDDKTNTVRIVNHTGHKLISGYPEGRRMWLTVTWYDDGGTLLREDGAYGPIEVLLDGIPTTVNSILDLNDPNTKIYEAHYGMTREWASQLIGLGYPADLPLEFDRMTGSVAYTLGDLATDAPGTAHETFHFVLNNTVLKDNRIPPYGMSYDIARARNALPVPPDQYGDPGGGGIYDYFDVFQLSPPDRAVYADIELKYQPTSWEYIQFLHLANDRLNPFLADEGINLLHAWLNTGMAEPYVVTSAQWGKKATPPTPTMSIASLTTWCVDRRGNFEQPCDAFGTNSTMGYMAVVRDPGGAPVSGAQVFTEMRDPAGSVIQSQQAFTDQNGEAAFTWKIGKKEALGIYEVVVSRVIHSSYEYDASTSVTTSQFTVR